MKKTICVCLVFLFLVLIPLQVMATEEPTFLVGDGTAKPGETVQVPVSIANNSGIIALCIHIAYDADVLTLQSVTDGTLFPGGTVLMSGQVQTNPYTVIWEDSLSRENYTQNGTFVTLQFLVSETAAPGNTTVSVTYDTGSTFDTDLNSVTFSTRNGVVTVQQPQTAPELVVPEGATTVVDADRRFIYGLKLSITQTELLNDYLGVTGSGHLELDSNMGYVGTGAKVRLVDDTSGETAAEYTVILFGDLDGDGMVSNQDIVAAKNMNAQIVEYTMDEAAAFAADLFEDGMLSNQDITILKSMQAGLITLDQSTKEQHKA